MGPMVYPARRLAYLVMVIVLGALAVAGAAVAAPPPGATAQCRDGTYSYSQHHSGTCSWHGGVAAWLDTPAVAPPTRVVSPPAAAPSLATRQGALALVRRKGYTPVGADAWSNGASLSAFVARPAVSMVGGYDARIFFFRAGRYLGVDSVTSSGEASIIWRDADTVAVMYVLYRRDDPWCCPTGGGAIVRFHWNGARLVPLDRIPSANADAAIHR